MMTSRSNEYPIMGWGKLTRHLILLIITHLWKCIEEKLFFICSQKCEDDKVTIRLLVTHRWVNLTMPFCRHCSTQNYHSKMDTEATEWVKIYLKRKRQWSVTKRIYQAVWKLYHTQKNNSFIVQCHLRKYRKNMNESVPVPSTFEWSDATTQSNIILLI